MLVRLGNARASRGSWLVMLHPTGDAELAGANLSPVPDDRAPGATRGPRTRGIQVRSRHRTPPAKVTTVKTLACLALALLLAGCIPIGARVSNLYTQAPAAERHA